MIVMHVKDFWDQPRKSNAFILLTIFSSDWIMPNKARFMQLHVVKNGCHGTRVSDHVLPVDSGTNFVARSHFRSVSSGFRLVRPLQPVVPVQPVQPARPFYYRLYRVLPTCRSLIKQYGARPLRPDR